MVGLMSLESDLVGLLVCLIMMVSHLAIPISSVSMKQKIMLVIEAYCQADETKSSKVVENNH